MFHGAQLKSIPMELLSKENGEIVVQDVLELQKVCIYDVEYTLNETKILLKQFYQLC